MVSDLQANIGMEREHMILQTYRYKISYWFLFLFAFAGCEIMAVGTLTKNLADLLAGNFSILDYIVFTLVILICFPVGIFALAVPFSAKIILGPQGVEFHSISAILKADWADLTVGIIETPSGSYKTLLCSRYEVTLRKWAKYLPWDVARGLRELGIPFSQFGSFTSRSFLTTIDRYAPHLKILE